MFSKHAPSSGAAAAGPALEPILVDYFTRDGSTLMMRLLATSPQIVVEPRYPYEQKYFAYLHRWARLLDRRQWPRDFWSGHHLASLTQEDYMPFMGPPPWLPRGLLEPRREGEEISGYAFRMIWGEFSGRAAAHAREQRGSPDADVRYYAEKHLNTWRVKLEDFPPVRLIALLRDPRDTYVSIEAYRSKRSESGQRAFAMGRLPGEADDVWLARSLQRHKERLGWIHQALKQGTMPVVRYEDLVRDLPGQARRLEEWLGVGLDPEAAVTDDRLQVHVSADTPESSIGRWRTEMPAELARRFNDALGDELKALGFEVPGATPSTPKPAVARHRRAVKSLRPRPKPSPRATRAPAALDATRENRTSLAAAVELVEDDQRELRGVLATANEDRAKLRAALEAAAIEKTELRRELHETERWLRQLEASRSWRITRPIRAAGAAFRRLSQ